MINTSMVKHHVFTQLDKAEHSQLPSTAAYLYGTVIYPPVAVLDQQATDQLLYTGVNWQAAQKVPGITNCLQKNNFLALVASQQTSLKQARALVDVDWLHATNTATDTAAQQDHYSWELAEQNQLAWAVAYYTEGVLKIWLSTAYTKQLYTEIQALTGLAAENIEIYQNTTVLTEAYDVGVEAALIALEVHKPVCVQAETQLQVIRFSLQEKIQKAAMWSTNALPSLGVSVAAYLLGWRRDQAHHLTVATDYAARVTADSAANFTPMGNAKDYAAALSFAVESEFDEQQRQQGLDPLQERLLFLQDTRGKQLIERVAQQAGWIKNGVPTMPKEAQRGYGFAYVKALDYEQEPAKEVWSAWAVELGLDTERQQLSLNKVTVAFDTDSYVEDTEHQNNQLKKRIGQWTQKLLGMTAAADNAQQNLNTALAAIDADSQSTDIQIQVVNQSALAGRSLAWSKTAELPAAAAIANAVKDATGVRLYHAPLDLSAAVAQLEYKKRKKSKSWLAWLGGAATALTGALWVASPWKAAIPPVMAIDTSIFSQQAIERGRLVALAGDCMVCHTAEGGKTNAGGLALDTPFGAIYTTNITPDPETGIGTWSYKAFERAMREGIHQDGRHLYPAFPYTSYAQMSDEDLQSLYAYLMTQEPVRVENPKTELPFPFNMRPALAGWNLLFHNQRQAYQPNEDQTQLWNRGAYLVNSSGHCMACHSPRNALGAEKKGNYFLAGGEADGWEAPALNAMSKAPIPWTEQELFQYLRTGQSARHGTAAGPMGPVISGLAELPEYDVRAMAHYLVNLNPDTPQQTLQTEASHASQAIGLESRAQRVETDLLLMPGQQLFAGACAVCHDASEGPTLFGAKPSLALNTNIQSENPDNLIQVIMHGITRPSAPGLGNMPAFKNSFNDQQMKDLVQYVRKRYAPNEPAWKNVEQNIQAVRNQAGHL